jgi:hypothetical protein
MAWDMGADRSIAAALPALLLNPPLCARARVSAAEVCEGIRAVATSPFDEARARLTKGLQAAWAIPCDKHSDAHAAILIAARRMIAMAGLSPRTPYATARRPFPIHSRN